MGHNSSYAILIDFCSDKRITRQYSVPRTPQPNGVVENGDVYRGKFEAKAHEAIFVGYSRRAYRVYIIDEHKVKESVNVTFDDTKLPSIQTEDPSESLKFDNYSDSHSNDEGEPYAVTGHNDDNNDDNDPGNSGGNNGNTGDTTNASGGSTNDPDSNSGGDIGSTSTTQHQLTYQDGSSRSNLPRERVWSREHLFELIIGDPDVGVRIRSATQNECLFSVFLSQEEPKKIEDALSDPDWVLAMQEEINQFERQEVWILVYKNKLDGDGIVTRNKARLVAKGYSQENGIDYDNTYAPVARLEAIRNFLAFTTHSNFKVEQMAILNRKLEEEVHVEQPHGFENPEFTNFGRYEMSTMGELPFFLNL
ncbi:uncharacterized protein LOC141660500 [Apium graveolens]|uniref:uncharacterized protein LOC141660500 n=1 Tax=Apium graveolens TaxID=4045 RepID=UPI003D7A9AF9